MAPSRQIFNNKNWSQEHPLSITKNFKKMSKGILVSIVLMFFDVYRNDIETNF